MSSSSAARLTAPERGDLVLQAGDFGLQLGGLGAVGQAGFEAGLVGRRLAQLQLELRLHQHGFLVLQLQLLDGAAQRIEPLLAGQARLVVASQLGGQAFQRVARGGQRGFGFGARGQGELQFGIQRVGRQAGQFVARLGQARLVVGDFLVDARQRFAEFLDLVGAGGEREAGFLMPPLGRALQFARLEHGAVGLVALLARGVQRFAGGVALRAVILEAGFQRLQRGALAGRAGG